MKSVSGRSSIGSSRGGRDVPEEVDARGCVSSLLSLPNVLLRLDSGLGGGET